MSTAELVLVIVAGLAGYIALGLVAGMLLGRQLRRRRQELERR